MYHIGVTEVQEVREVQEVKKVREVKEVREVQKVWESDWNDCAVRSQVHRKRLEEDSDSLKGR